MKKSFFAVILFIAMFFIFSASSYEVAPATEGFQNLKVLPKDITKQKLDSIMDNWCISLGVKCGFCHAANKDSTIRRLDFASDAKEEKGTARFMFNMTAEINANYFNYTNSTQKDTLHSVVCYTCHRGTKGPNANAFLSLIDSTLQSRKKR